MQESKRGRKMEVPDVAMVEPFRPLQDERNARHAEWMLDVFFLRLVLLSTIYGRYELLQYQTCT